MWCLLFIAGVTAIVAGVSVSLGKPVLGLDAWAFVDAGIFAIAGWRIWRLSRIWAVSALALFIIETVYAVESSPDVPAAGAYLRVVLALALIAACEGRSPTIRSERRNRRLLGRRVSLAIIEV